jgi:RimJ/RimL family protein N-acetyltransferase
MPGPRSRRSVKETRRQTGGWPLWVAPPLLPVIGLAFWLTRGRPIHFAIREPSGRVIGGCGFNELTVGHRAEIGYWLAKPCWGRGIMTEVVERLCEMAWTEWKLVRITAHVFPFNEASARVLEKNGFQLEGVLRKHHQKDGQFLDAKFSPVFLKPPGDFSFNRRALTGGGYRVYCEHAPR